MGDRQGEDERRSDAGGLTTGRSADAIVAGLFVVYLLTGGIVFVLDGGAFWILWAVIMVALVGGVMVWMNR